MRATVDEKLQSTLEKRLGESFKMVSERLEQVYKGLGEMQTLAVGVGDLKKVLTNVEISGNLGRGPAWGDARADPIAPTSMRRMWLPKGEGERVEFAIKLPGRGEHQDDLVWMPIDAKFPVEDYQRLVEAQEKAHPVAAEEAAKQLENRIKQCAADICTKYIGPPKTTDFGILICRPKVCSRKSSAGLVFPSTSSGSAVWSLPGRQHCGQSSIACRWAFGNACHRKALKRGLESSWGG